MKKTLKLLSRAETCADVMLNNGWEGNGHKSIVTKIGGVAILNALIRNGNKTSGITMCTIPVGFRPYQTVIAFAVTAEEQKVVVINTNGEIQLTSDTFSSVTNVQITASWIIGS